ncbi:type VI secretion protein VasK [Burkholderia sp. AU42008]|uniref:ImcF-related family protein n=1 Tax=unclassified Burkholderia TaxID=2613784 RepID=UPI000B7A2828|nr:MULTISPECIES: ImcF-related family protein [unclassified Burkholderia]MBR8233182.1 type VI secretion protein VasK [Burkholderia sp. AU32357]MBY4876384.1 type VI secretion protein VasK [Burkholderia sp. AU42008]OXI40680.1 type VI secretion protein VasK [Burkholderia sp. AU17457]
MSSKKMSGYWIVIGALTAIAGIVAYYMGETVHPSPLVRMLAVALVGALLLAMEGLVRGAWRWTARTAGTKQRSRYERDPAARVGAPEAAVGPVTGNWATDLKVALRHRYGWRWRYRLPWLLLAATDSTIGRLSPELAARGWMITSDAVLLWGRQGSDGRQDDVWLRRIRRMRCRRPVDAIVLAVNDTTLSQEGARGGNDWAVHLARVTRLLRWSAPVYVLDLAGEDSVHHADTPVTGCEFANSTDASAIEAALLELRDRLADISVGQLARHGDDRHLSDLSARLDMRSGPLARWIVNLSDWQRRPQPVVGAFFAPWPAPGTEGAGLPLWRYLRDAAARRPGRRTGAHPIAILSTHAMAIVGLWGAGMLMSGLTNARELALTNDALRTLERAADASARLRALLALQQRIEFYEARIEHPRLFSRFGLNHDQDVLAALWTRYPREARPQLIAPVQQNIEAQLVDLAQMPATALDDQAGHLARAGHAALKAYLMMVEPTRADAAFLTPQLARYWSGGAGLSAGEKLDLSQRLLSFYAQHLSAHPDWRIAPRDDLVGGARQTLLAVIGVRNSDDTIYQEILGSVGHKYPDQTLASLTAGTDTRGLLRTSASVPGAFTRQAWDGTIEASIDAMAKRNGVTADWVLGTGGAHSDALATTPDALRAALRARYFADYAEHWQTFMNGIVCEPARTLPAAIAQLKVIADARQSPVIALMKSLEYHGGAGAVRTSLSDTLVTKAQSILASKDDAPQVASPDPAGPLGASFGPVLRLVAAGGAAGAGAIGDLSLQRFTERLTMLRLKLQQIADSPDADGEARQVAHALFQGRSSELADTLAYAQLIAASLGEQWAGMGQALFVRPAAQAAQAVLEPAQASLNDVWRQTIVATWNRSFAGRYPFANTINDASLPELARFLRPQGGLIGSFLATQLAGVLTLQGDQWVPASTGSGASSAARTIDPGFLDAINRLQRIAAHLLAQGEPRYAFDLKPVPVSGVIDTRLTIDGQVLHYYNQQETWQTFTWPSSEPQKAGTRLEWQTERSGTNLNLEFNGRWALVRMLERAQVTPVDTATYQLTWQAAVPLTPETRAAGVQAGDDDALTTHGPLTPAPSSLTYPLTYLMRMDVGKGPLELLSLRGFALPSRIFASRPSTPRAGGAASQPSPLPPGAVAAARHASVPIPGGPIPE